MKVQNPILKGFNPDPSIIRVGDNYYIATSTFEWFPGVQIHHSKDLANWNLVKRPLERKSQLDLLGVPDSCGVWAPCLSYHEGIFYLIYSNVKSFDGVWKDTPNYLITTDNILGDWSEPVFLDSRGFDASLFHDDNGRKWYVTMKVDHRRGTLFGGIELQEFDPKAKTLIGQTYKIFQGTSLGCTEGPHLYKKDGYYYLITAEGGTEYNHAVTIARSKEVVGPYEVHPQNPLISCKNIPQHSLQKSGHGDFVQSPNGDWFIVFLVSRPLKEQGRCTLGRETAIEKIHWAEGDWPSLEAGRRLPRLTFEIEGVDSEQKQISHFDDFDNEELNIHFQSLRVPMENWMSLLDRPAYLRLKGRESLSSFHYQSMIARRVQHFNVEVSTKIDFHPASFQQMAGLVFYYNTSHFHYLHITQSREGKRILFPVSCDKFNFAEHEEDIIELPENGEVFLKGHFDRESIQFYYRLEHGEWIKVGKELDGSILSDDYVQDHDGRYRPAFTGSFVGLCCQDLSGHDHFADFDWFEYKVLED